MRRMRVVVGTAALSLVLAFTTGTFAGTAFGASAGAATARLAGSHVFPAGRAVPAGTGTRAICAHPSANVARCLAIGVTVRPGSSRLYQTSVQVAGLGPADIQSAYKLPSSGGDGNTVAVVEAGNYPNLEADLAVYRANFGLPACTEANGCLSIVNEHGGSTLPPRRNGWSYETALDVDSVSAACPDCHILVVEAQDAHKKHLGVGNATAAKMGAMASSNSWKIPEFQGMDSGQFAKYFSAPGVAFTASSGDGGHTSQVTIGYPAGLTTVLAIGGTALTADNSHRGWHETAWSGAGSACGQYVEKPAWQKDKGCTMRATSDVSADAAPSTGLAVYHTLPNGQGGWMVFGGTSLSSPLIAAMFALRGNVAKLGTHIASHLYANADHLYDVKSGSNGTCPPEYPYICQAGPGYDGPTGLGTPHGLGAL